MSGGVSYFMIADWCTQFVCSKFFIDLVPCTLYLVVLTPKIIRQGL